MTKPVTEREDGEVCIEVEDKRNRKMTAKLWRIKKQSKTRFKSLQGSKLGRLSRLCSSTGWIKKF